MNPWVPLAGAALFVGACAHPIGELDDGLSSAERQASLEAIPDWDMRGGLAIETADSSHQARVNWSQRGDRLQLEVRGGPGGIASAFRIAGDASSLSIESRGESRTLSNPETELSAELGWWLPVASLEHWLLGQADPDYPRRLDRGAAGTLTSLDQRDWQIRYEQYQLIAGLLVPRIMTLTHSSLKLRLVVRDFEPVAP